MPRESKTALRNRAAAIAAELERLYPDASCSLHFADPFQLLVATVLSAQCTDERVNKVTPALFAAAPDAETLALLPQRKIETLIHSTGFFRNKAKNLKGAALAIVADHGGRLPMDRDSLVALPGVGRKTANVILGNAFGLPGFPVDTHVGRLSRRLRLTREEDPVKVEFALMDLYPQERWTMLSHQLIYHGRAICGSRKPACRECSLAALCPSAGKV